MTRIGRYPHDPARSHDITWILASDRLDDKRAMLWSDEQRGIGELMSSDRDSLPAVRGHASFHRDYEPVFADWMERFADDLLTPAALRSDRLRLLNWALFGVVRLLDEEGVRAHDGGWMRRASEEIKNSSSQSAAKPEASLRSHLEEAQLT